MVDLKIGVVGLPGAWSTEVLADAVEERTNFRCIIDYADVRIDLNKKRAWYKDYDLCSFDALIVKKISKSYSPVSVDRLLELDWIKKQGVPVYSDPYSMSLLVNRLGCTLALSSMDILMPKTAITESVDQAVNIVSKYGSCVLKPLFSTKARGMCVVNHDDTDLREQLIAFQCDNPVMYIQQKIPLPGRDLGLMFLGGEYIGSYARVSTGDSWNTTTRDGGKYACHTPQAETIEIARKAQACFNLTYTVVDIVEHEDPSQTIVFEVSAFGGFRGAKEGCGIDVASMYADYVVEQINTKGK